MDLIKLYLQGVTQWNLRTKEHYLLGPTGFNILWSQENHTDGMMGVNSKEFYVWQIQRLEKILEYSKRMVCNIFNNPLCSSSKWEISSEHLFMCVCMGAGLQE